MGQLVSYLPQVSDSCGLKAVLPIVGQSNLTVAIGSGSVPTALFTAVTTGSPAYSSGQITNDGCAWLRIVATYLTGSDCNPCTSDAISTSDVTVLVPPRSVFPLPYGLISEATYETGSVDSAGVFTASNVTKVQKVGWYSNYQPCCDGAVLVP